MAELNELLEEAAGRAQDLSQDASEAIQGIRTTVGGARSLSETVEQQAQKAVAALRAVADKLDEAEGHLEAEVGEAGGEMDALATRAGRSIPLSVGNDGNFGGVAEAQRVRGQTNATVILLAPGSGLGCAYIDRHGLPLDGDTLAGMEAGHMPAPLHELNVKPYPCGCGRTWGCVELYTTLAGLPYLLAERLADYPDHPLARSTDTPKQKALALRGLAQKGDKLAVELFDFQARAMGLHIANLTLALDPEFVVIGGGLMDPENTTEAFRERYLRRPAR